MVRSFLTTSKKSTLPMVQRKQKIECVAKKSISPSKPNQMKRTYNEAFKSDLNGVNNAAKIANGDNIFSRFTVNTDIDGPMRESRVKRAKLNLID